MIEIKSHCANCCARHSSLATGADLKKKSSRTVILNDWDGITTKKYKRQVSVSARVNRTGLRLLETNWCYFRKKKKS